MNSGRVVNEHAFRALKKRWRILKHFNMNMDKVTTLTLAYCVFHNFYEIYAERDPLPEDVALRTETFVGVRRDGMRLSSDGRVGKLAGKQMEVVYQ